ncbi:caspase family protein [Prosthecobacter sp.]|uniref:caspase family protein n=1 Tax=Prosthecobacter sp. TaxID=1965333 RepID=UPI003784FDC7
MKRLLLTFCTLSFTLSTFAAERQGIVIGNRDYSDTGRFPDLSTTLNDAALMHRLMTQAGFKMAPEVKNATRLGMEEALIKFCEGQCLHKRE